MQTIIALIATGLAVQAADFAAYHQAIRNNRLDTLKTLVSESGTDVRNRRAETPLMSAAAFGTLDAMRLLVDAGADVNAHSDFNATALMWATADLEKVRYLLSKGANVKARTSQGRDALYFAAKRDGAVDIVRALLDAGADAKNPGPDPGLAPISAAAGAGDYATFKLLIDRGAPIAPPYGIVALISAAATGSVPILKTLIAAGLPVNAASPPTTGQTVKNGPIDLGSFTPLLLASPYAGPEAVGLLVRAKANVNAQDVRGMTPLIFAIATDHPSPAVVRLLLDAGADPKIKSKTGEDAYDWARKFNNPAVLAELGLKPDRRAATLAERPVTLDAAIDRGRGILEKTTNSFFIAGGCPSCHSHNVPAATFKSLEAAGRPADPAALKTIARQTLGSWVGLEQPLMQYMDPGGGGDTVMYALWELEAERVPAGFTTDVMVHYVASLQQEEGNWHQGGIARPPIEDGDISRTAVSLYGLRAYAAPALKPDIDRRIAKAAAWLDAAVPVNIEDLNFRMLGLHWAGRDVAKLAAALATTQNPDGGWSQTPNLASDAYATGQTLTALREVGYDTTSPAWRKGVDFLLRTQQSDGSWRVVSRTSRLQPYFQSGFPYDHDQWISMSATAWATNALARHAPNAR